MDKNIVYIKNQKYFSFVKNDLELINALEEFSAYVFYLYQSLNSCNDNYLLKFKKHTIEIYM
jgi:hypothetical protein